MKTPMFVLAGLPGNNSNASLAILHTRLEELLKEKNINLIFERKGELLLSRLDGVSFYCSFLSHKSELNDWFRMARDFELKCNKKPLSKNGLQAQYADLLFTSPDTYKPVHFSIAEAIFDEMEKFNDVTIYAFH